MAKQIAYIFTGETGDLFQELDNGVPTIVRLLNAGDNQATGIGDNRLIKVLDVDAIIAASARDGVDLVIDYNHSTDLVGNEGGEAPAAGWIKRLFKGEDGSLMATVEWTPKARSEILGKQYRYLSPVVTLTNNGEAKAVLRAALTNNPALTLGALNTSKGANTMALSADTRAALAALLKIEGDATDVAIAEATQQLGGGAVLLTADEKVAHEKQVEAATAVLAEKATGEQKISTDPNVERLTVVVEKLADRVELLTADSKATKEKDRQAKILTLIADQKATPAQRGFLETLTAEQLDAFSGAATPMLAGRTVTAGSGDNVQQFTVTPAMEELASATNIPVEEIAKAAAQDNAA